MFPHLLGRRLPIVRGTLEIGGIEGPIRIRRDTWGIPHIAAQSSSDAWFGLGFCQGQDRAFQLEVLSRLVRGTLAALVGEKALPLDRTSRHLGFRRHAAAQVGVQSAATGSIVKAFARGVVAGTRHGLTRRPHEFALLRAHPSAFEPTDVMGILGIFSFALASNWDAELMRLRIAHGEGAEVLRRFDPALCAPRAAAAQHGERTDGGRRPDVIDLQRLQAFEADLRRFQEATRLSGASNNWVLASRKTRTGRALLANDPHLAPVLPPHWYLAHLATPSWSLAGAALAGTPGIAAGHNGHVAWGVTAGLADNTDLFLERLDASGTAALTAGEFQPCDVFDEEIEVRHSQSRRERVVATPRGPVVSAVLDSGGTAVSMRGVWMEPRPVNGFLQLARARSGADLRRAFAAWPFLSLNVVHASLDGDIGWELVGELPRRCMGNGVFPLPGWEVDAPWEESTVDVDSMPSIDNPTESFVATANGAPPGDDLQRAALGVDWLDEYRSRRIRAALRGRDDWDVADLLALQLDTDSLLWRELRDRVLALKVETRDEREALAVLASWDGDVAADSIGASVFEFFVSHLCREIMAELSGRSSEALVGANLSPLQSFTTLVARHGECISRFVAGDHDVSHNTVDAALCLALRRAFSDLTRRYGSDTKRWRWGQVRPLVLRHPLGVGRLLGSIFNRGPFPCGGDANTVSQAAVNLLEPSSDVLFNASLRMVVDVGSWDASRFVLPGGQSGNPCSPHYDDQLEFWLKGAAVPMAFSEEAVANDCRSELVLRPTQYLEDVADDKGT